MKTNIMRRAALASIFGGAAVLRAQSSAPSPAKALPDGGLRNHPAALDSIEQLAKQILKEVSEVRAGTGHVVGKPDGQPVEVTAARTNTSLEAGETRGMFRAMQPVRPY
jgi:hypothetical protein